MPRGLIEVDTGALQAARERASFSIEDVCRRTGIAPATLRHIEDSPARNLRPATVRRLALALGVDVEQLRKASA